VDCEAGLWERARISALLHEDVDQDTLLVCLRDRTGAEQNLHHRIELLEDRNWVDEFHRDNCSCASARSYVSATVGAVHRKMVNLRLSSPPTFGTGAHDRTSPSLGWMTGHDLTGKQVIDYGCGSEILVLSALRLGAEHARAVDIDPLALEVSRKKC
jgi:ribosomal protein L11 methyltransferase